MVIGGYWIGLTLFVVPALSIDTPWALVGLLQVVAALGLWLVVPRRIKPGAAAESWTHPAAVGLLATWPVAWIFLILLGKSLLAISRPADPARPLGRPRLGCRRFEA